MIGKKSKNYYYYFTGLFALLEALGISAPALRESHAGKGRNEHVIRAGSKVTSTPERIYPGSPAGQTFSKFLLNSTERPAAEVEVSSIQADRANTVWCGSRHPGLFRLDRRESRFTSYSRGGFSVRDLYPVKEEIRVGRGLEFPVDSAPAPAKMFTSG